MIGFHSYDLVKLGYPSFPVSDQLSTTPWTRRSAPPCPRPSGATRSFQDTVETTTVASDQHPVSNQPALVEASCTEDDNPIDVTFVLKRLSVLVLCVLFIREESCVFQQLKLKLYKYTDKLWTCVYGIWDQLIELGWLSLHCVWFEFVHSPKLP